MKKKIGINLFFLGIFLFFAVPVYQAIDMKIKNVSGDGEEVYGDNPLFRNILGVKTVYYVGSGGEWEQYGVSIQTPLWMQKAFDLPSEVSNSDDSNNGCLWKVQLVRFSIKALLPLLLVILGLLILPKEKIL